MKRLISILLAFVWAVGLHAETTDTLNLTCGEEVLVTASPKPGYHFVQWSDGVTDNPRTIEVRSDWHVEAIFAPDCIDPEVPVQALYDNLLMLDRVALRAMGFEPTENEVSWYRIVGTIDEPDALLKDDEWMGTGYYFMIDPSVQSLKDYYCQVRISPSVGSNYCYEYLRSRHNPGTGMDVPCSEEWLDDTRYNVLGLPVTSDYKGVIIQRGRKRLRL